MRRILYDENSFTSLSTSEFGRHYTFRTFRSRKKFALSVIFIVFLLAVVVVSVGIAIAARGGRRLRRRQRFAVGAVVSDHAACSEVGRDILMKGGSAVDAAIATLLCNGVRQPHSMGLGGGCFMVIYNRTSREADVINGRETAPRAASREMYINHSYSRDPLTIGVPGEVMAYWMAHQKYGVLPWRLLFEPAIKMAQEGHPLSSPTAKALKYLRFKVNFTHYPSFCSVFCNRLGEPLEAGDNVAMLDLSHTLSEISILGPDYIYSREKTDEFVEDIQRFGGLVSRQDMEGYTARTEKSLTTRYNDTTMYTVNAPGGGPLLSLILNIIEGFNLKPEDIATPEAETATYHKIIEAIKFSFAERVKIGDPLFVNISKLLSKITSKKYAEFLRHHIVLNKTQHISYYRHVTSAPWRESGTSHVSVLAPNGDAVSVTSTINSYFGSMFRSPSTGIFLNNEMDDFSKPAANSDSKTSANFIEPGKQPLSSMSPCIFVDKSGEPILVLGSAGGERITPVNAQVAIRILWLKQKVEKAVDEKRFHHRLEPNVLMWEPGFNSDVLIRLMRFGHELKESRTNMSVVQAITRDPETGRVHAASDKRKGGSASFIYSDEIV